ncbi:2-hydroxychromene-2-carboxylate isomerase [Oceanibacterium hippocampi]|uniref:2-hydroxychromene-2-carboxylate isomerase n=1 Tax=Oceanibacterium hippocampi TaxID=745714 RepID=A0A1Y5S1I7_9PROT|nr:2-hydroxychromene-2-carboxylate isomerase [Oceanibacterium hippocampi]SLN30186.1 2-hydroxychromene-2-carboxylate isomerase [Oceanibacterium hippocampi]
MAEIEYFYSGHSAFAYLGSARLMEIAKASGRRIAHRPFDLRRLVSEIDVVPLARRSKAHVDYYFGREIMRWSEYRNAPTCSDLPTHHHHDPAMANGMLIAGLQQGLDIDRLAHVMLERHWRHDGDLADRDTLAEIGRAAGLDPEPLLARALAPDVQQVYQANTDEALRRSVFGSPTYFVDGDMFYGQDRLEMVERALKQPFATR